MVPSSWIMYKPSTTVSTNFCGKMEGVSSIVRFFVRKVHLP